MRTSFVSLAFPSEAASRLAALLPALSLDRARDWTAQVYGYRDWAELIAEVENAPVPAGPDLTPDLKYALDSYYAGRSTQEDRQRHELQIQKLDELLGWSRRAAEHLYVVWEPRFSGTVREVHLGNIGAGTPAFHLMQRNIFVVDAEPGPISASDAGYVYLDFPGATEEWKSAVAAFSTKLASHLPASEQLALVAELTRVPQALAGLVKLDEGNTFGQVLPMTFVACRELDDPEIIGAGSMTFSLIASREGRHFVEINLERIVTSGDEALLLTFADAMAVAVWEAITRYLWTTVGNSDPGALVRIQYRAGDQDAKTCATEVRELVARCCGLPLSHNSSGDQGIQFELEPING